jgi:hypothetical protein
VSVIGIFSRDSLVSIDIEFEWNKPRESLKRMSQAEKMVWGDEWSVFFYIAWMIKRSLLSQSAFKRHTLLFVLKTMIVSTTSSKALSQQNIVDEVCSWLGHCNSKFIWRTTTLSISIDEKAHKLYATAFSIVEKPSCVMQGSNQKEAVEVVIVSHLCLGIEEKEIWSVSLWKVPRWPWVVKCCVEKTLNCGESISSLKERIRKEKDIPRNSSILIKTFGLEVDFQS